MAIANRISKKTVVRKQTGLGNVGSNTGQVVRRVSSISSAMRDMYESNEIVAHNQHEGTNYGRKHTTSVLQGELSPATFQLYEEAMFQAAYAAVVTTGAVTSIAASSGTFTDSGNGFLTAGFKVGMVARASGFSGAGATANNARNFFLTGVTAGVMSGVFLDGTTMIDDAAGESVTITSAGKTLSVPLASHTKDYLQVEEWYSDNTDSDLFTDLIVGSIEYGLPASGIATIGVNMVGLSRALSGSQVMTSPTAETETGLMAAVNGVLYVNGTATPVTGVTITISNGAAALGAEIGSNSPADVSRGTTRVSGTFSSFLRDQTISALYDAETPVSLIVAITADATATSDFRTFTLGKIKITGDAPDDSDAIMRTYPFVAQINHDGGSAVAWPETILMTQDSDAA